MSKASILFVDNDSNFLAERQEFLQQEGYEVLPADTPQKAWKILGERKIDLAILDVRLVDDNDKHDESGLQLAKEIVPKVPVIILTGFPVDKHIVEVLRIVGEKSHLRLDIVSKDEGLAAMLLAVTRTRALMALQNSPHRESRRSNKVFVVYGHDKQAKQEVMNFLNQIGVDPVDISVKTSQGRTIIDQIKYYSNVKFAVVLLTPDDVYLSRKGKKIRRPRQNVTFELGYFMGVLGSDKVCALRKGNVEILSDYQGVIYKKMDRDGAWKVKLAQELKTAGLEIDMKKVLEA